MINQTISGIQEAQRWNLRAIANLRPDGAFGHAIRDITTQVHRYEVTIAHVDTGAMRASLRIEIQGLKARTYLDTAAKNPQTGAKTSVYGEIENARGGDHAFGLRTVNEAAPRIVVQALGYLGRSLQ